MMTLFTIEAHGRPVLVLPADDVEEVEEQIAGSIGEDLMLLEHNGEALWNGEEDQLFVREAHPKEAARWEASFAEAVRDGEVERGEREEWVAFLLDVVDPTDDPDLREGDA